MIEPDDSSIPLEFTEAEKKAVYKAIYLRRDVREHFLPRTIPDAVLRRLLDAAHHAGSVGFMQPWSFVVIRSEEVKKESRTSSSKRIKRPPRCSKAKGRSSIRV